MNDYNIARVFALYKSYWAAMNKIYIYAPPCVNKMTWAFFFIWLQSFRPVKLQCTFPSLWNMEETSEELAKTTLQQDRSQYNLSKFFLQTMSYMCAIIDPLSSWTFHSLAGEICMIEAKKAKKTEWLYFDLARHTYIINDGFQHPKMKHLALFTMKSLASMFISFRPDRFTSRDRSDRDYN